MKGYQFISWLLIFCFLMSSVSAQISVAVCIYKHKLFGPWNSCSEDKFSSNYDAMKAANCLNCDKYFHCMANYEAIYDCTGSNREETARKISDCRDDPSCTDADCLADRAANLFGRNGGNCATEYLCANSCSYKPSDRTCKKSNCP